MPPKAKFTREEVIEAAVELTRAGGAGAVTARALGARLGTSPKPIFGLFRNMEELQEEVIRATQERYLGFIREEQAAAKYPPYKSSGMAYIRFAGEEPELFRLLFLRDRSREKKDKTSAWDPDTGSLIAALRERTGLSQEEAERLHTENWIFVHGIATMVATSYLTFDTDFISESMSDIFLGLYDRFKRKGEKQ